MEVLEGGMTIRNRMTGAQGSLAVVVRNNKDQLIGLTCHHVIFGSKNDEIQAKKADGSWEKIGFVLDGSEPLDVAVVAITETSAWNILENSIEGKPVVKLSSARLKPGGIIYKYGAFSKGWTKGRVLSPKKSKLTIESVGKSLGIPGDSGSAWIHGPAPYTLCGIHFWGSDDGRTAFARKIEKVIQRFELRAHPGS